MLFPTTTFSKYTRSPLLPFGIQNFANPGPFFETEQTFDNRYTAKVLPPKSKKSDSP
jgi:hypothetical protein